MAPQVRGTPEPFISNVAHVVRKARPPAVRFACRPESDVEDAFTDETSRRLLSRAAVSEINVSNRLGQLSTSCPFTPDVASGHHR